MKIADPINHSYVMLLLFARQPRVTNLKSRWREPNFVYLCMIITAHDYCWKFCQKQKRCQKNTHTYNCYQGVTTSYPTDHVSRILSHNNKCNKSHTQAMTCANMSSSNREQYYPLLMHIQIQSPKNHNPVRELPWNQTGDSQSHYRSRVTSHNHWENIGLHGYMVLNWINLVIN